MSDIVFSKKLFNTSKSKLILVNSFSITESINNKKSIIHVCTLDAVHRKLQPINFSPRNEILTNLYL